WRCRARAPPCPGPAGVSISSSGHRTLHQATGGSLTARPVTWKSNVGPQTPNAGIRPVTVTTTLFPSSAAETLLDHPEPSASAIQLLADVPPCAAVRFQLAPTRAPSCAHIVNVLRTCRKTPSCRI